MKNKIVIPIIVVIIMLFLARSMYSDYNLKKIISACVITKTKSSSIEEAKKICEDKLE
jgi:hypothetical protein